MKAAGLLFDLDGVLIALRTTTAEEKLGGAHYLVDDLRNVEITSIEGGFEIQLV